VGTVWRCSCAERPSLKYYRHKNIAAAGLHLLWGALPLVPPVSIRRSGADQLISTSLWQWNSCPSSLQMSMSLSRSLLKNSDILGAMPLFVLMVMLDTSSSCVQGRGRVAESE
jgi:hypothetical protein